jgi:DNA helicase-2/ATP-dependent DNA helicase PcrA
MRTVRNWLAQCTSNDAWTSDAPGGTKILVAMHKLAARRLGFAGLYAAFHPPRAPASLAAGFDDGTAWPIAPFVNVILPLCETKNDTVALRILRKHGLVLRDDITGPGIVRERLRAARVAVHDLRALFAAAGTGSVGAALRHAHRTGLIEAVPQLARYLNPDGAHSDQVLSEKIHEVLDAFMACDVSELAGYLRYVKRESPYSTQHGTKGSEFSNVVVLIDDAEGSMPAYSYDKLLGIKELSETDRGNRDSGKDTTVDRSRRLLYVCVSRAQEELAVVIYANDVEAAILSKLSEHALTINDLVGYSA